MLFNSYYFVLYFLPLVVAGYFLLHHFGWHKAALLWLTAASLFFYGYDNVKYLPVLVVSILLNWAVASFINKQGRGRAGMAALVLGILLDIGAIFYFKYLGFFVYNINKIIKLEVQVADILLPLGISFFTFQQVSYLVDTYRGETKAYKFSEYALFVSFFPQLVAGPIVLHSEMVPQFQDREKWKFDHDSFAHGIYLFSMGMCKKVLIADTFGKAVSWGWSALEGLSSLELILVMLSYTFQIYFDFSGYCDMAAGIARMFNFVLPVNFDSPYKAASIQEFWKRWHMTLTRFLRHYIYFPLGGSRKGKIRTYVNILTVFLLSGIWHGANWTFVFWGMLHGIAQVLERIFQKAWGKCDQVFRWMCTFTFVNFMWLIFRSDNIRQAIWLIKRIMRLDSFIISEDLIGQFTMQEVDLLVRHVRPLAYFKDRIHGFYMWAFFFFALFLCLNLPNLHEKKFEPTLAKAVGAAVLLVWTIVSFGGVSTFLYFNF